MSNAEKEQVIEMLARIAARLAGRDPNEETKVEFGGVVAFDDVMWRYPDFLARARAAYHVLEMYQLTSPH